jgi:hypothetical protein
MTGPPLVLMFQRVLALDGAMICDKLARYLGEDFDDFEISAVDRGGVSGNCDRRWTGG